MITINFLQTERRSTQHRFLRLKSTVASFVVLTTLLTGTQVFARVPEDFMERPTIVFPTANSVVPRDQFEIRGTAHNWALVDITIDGQFLGRAASINGKGSNATFAYKPASISLGTHVVQAFVRSETEVFKSPLTVSVMVQIVEPTPAPTLLTFAPSNDFRRPYIRGVAVNQTKVDIFIDGRLDQSFDAIGTGSSVSFSVQPRSVLSNGFHTVTAKSTATSGIISKSSNQRVFLVEAATMNTRTAPGLTGIPSTGPSIPRAPTLLSPENGSVLNHDRANVQGVSPNGLTIEAYVDGSLEQEVPVKSHPSGTGSFSFQTQELDSGYHGIYTVARDNQGNKSSRSNQLEFMVAPVGPVAIFTPNGERTVWYPTLLTSEPASQPKSTMKLPAQTVPTKPQQTTPTPDSNQENVQGDRTSTAIPATTVTEPEELPRSSIPARVIIGWTILGISILGILAYIIAAVVEHRQKQLKPQVLQSTTKTTVNLNQSPNQPPVQPTPTTKNHNSLDDDLGLNDDIPKGYQ